MKNKNDLKVGDYIYRLKYYSSPFKKAERNLECYKIKKVTDKNIITHWDWKIRKSQIGIEWFTSKKEVYQDALRLYEQEYGHIIKEMDYIKRKIKKLHTR